MKRGSARPVNAVTKPTRRMIARLARAAVNHRTAEMSVLATHAAIYVYVTCPLARLRTYTDVVAHQIRLSVSLCAGTVARTQGRRWSDKLIDLWTCEVAAS